MNKTTVLVLAVVVLLGLGYVGRQRIKSMLGMSTPAPVQEMAPANGSPSASASAPTTSSSDSVYMTKADPAKGSYMTDSQGMTLYTFDKDTKDVSNCSGGCLAAWPAYKFTTSANATLPANVTAITRADGGQQFAWKDMPLYYYTKDQKAGDITGDGVGGVWHIVKL